MPLSAGILDFSQLPPAAQAKQRATLVREDVPQGLRNVFNNKDVNAIINGTEVTIFGPTPDLSAALEAVRIERGPQ